MPSLALRIAAGLSGHWQLPDLKLEDAPRILGAVLIRNTAPEKRVFLEKVHKNAYDLIIEPLAADSAIKAVPGLRFDSIPEAVAGLHAACKALRKEGNGTTLVELFKTRNVNVLPDKGSQNDEGAVTLEWAAAELSRRERNHPGSPHFQFD